MDNQKRLTDSAMIEILSLSKNATAIYTTEDIIVETANEVMLSFWNKDKSIFGKPLGESVPELIEQSFIELLQNVWRTGASYEAREVLFQLEINGVKQMAWFDFEYRAIKKPDGDMYCILHTATDVTERIRLRQLQQENDEQRKLLQRNQALNQELAIYQKELEETNARLNIALDAGSFGSTEVDLATGTMICNDQFKRCFGVPADQELTYGQIFEAMLPQYREEVRRRAMLARETNSVYQADYEIMWPDGSIHWISAHGRGKYNSEGKVEKWIGIISDITESKRDEQRKNDFIGMVSHEMKTPLTSLSGFLQLLVMQAGNEDDFSMHMLDKAKKQVNKLNTLINGFLNVSILESGKIQIDKCRFDMAVLVKEAEEEVKTLYNNHRIVFHAVEETFIDADRDKIGQVINNLISNAVKYSPFNTEINVSCLTYGMTAVVSVKDEGMGIKEEDQPKLFDRYYRVNDNKNTTTAGFGIGLYLCAEIIQRHGGKIWVDSELGKGSTFSFSLPVMEQEKSVMINSD